MITYLLGFLVVFFAATAVLACYQFGAIHAENQQLRHFVTQVERVVTDHDLPERTLTQNDIATILKEIDACHKPL